jgi:hypothetical protein
LPLNEPTAVRLALAITISLADMSVSRCAGARALGESAARADLSTRTAACRY